MGRERKGESNCLRLRMPLGTIPKVGPTQHYNRVTQSVAMPIKHHNEIKPALPLAPGTGLYLVVDYSANSRKVRASEWRRRLRERRGEAVAKCRSRRSLALSVSLAAVQEEASQQRDCEKRSDCNVRWLGMSGKMSCGVVLPQCGSQEINGGFCPMAALQLRTIWQQTDCSGPGWWMTSESWSFRAHF